MRLPRRDGGGGGGSCWADGSEVKTSVSSTWPGPPGPALLLITGAELWPRLEVSRHVSSCGHGVAHVFVRETCMFHVLAHHQRPKFKAWWWWWCVGGWKGGGGGEKGVREVRLHVFPVCDVWNVPPSCITFGPDKPHARHPGQPSVACQSQHAAHTPTWQKMTSSNTPIFCVGVSTAKSGPTSCGEQLPHVSSGGK